MASTAAIKTARLAAAHLPPRRRSLPRQIWPEMIEREYLRQLAGVVAHARATLAPLERELPKLLANARDARGDSRLDADEGRRARELVDRAREEMRERIRPKEVERLARDVASRVSQNNREQLGRQVHAALGIDVPFRDPKLRALIDHFVQHNVSLISTIPTRIHDDVERMVTGAVASGTLHGDLADDLEDRFGVGETDAARIARDQTGKLYGQINHARQQELGIERFIWRTVGDNRVRDEHDELERQSENEPFRYDDPPDTDDGPALPGEPIQCRCYAEPVFEEIEDLAESDEGEEEPDDDGE